MGGMGGMAQALDDDNAVEARSAALHDLESLVICLAKRSDAAAALEAAKGDDSTVVSLIDFILTGDFAGALASPFGSSLLLEGATDGEDFDAGLERVGARVKALVDAAEEEDSHATQLSAVLIGVAALLLFMQANYAGPAPKDLAPSPCHKVTDAEAVQEWAVGAMEADSEDCYRLTHLTAYCMAAVQILVGCRDAYPAARSASWWGARALLAQQQQLQGNAASLFDRADALWLETAAALERSETAWNQEALGVELTQRCRLEMALWYHEFDRDVSLRDNLVLAKEAAGLTLEVTGMMGKRMKQQAFEVAQLTLIVTKTKPGSGDKAAERPAEEAGESGTAEGGVEEDAAATAMPQNVLLEESEVLETTAFSGEGKAQEPLSVLDQCTVLAGCINVQNENPLHGLTHEEMRPYIERVIEDGLKGDWTVSSTALLLRSKLERQRPKTVERSILQLQVLGEQFHDENPAAIERLRFLFYVDYPTHVRLEKIVGEGFLALNANKSALEIFERLELWSLVIECLGRLGEKKQAEEVARKQLAVKETPEMWCNLGDILKEPDMACYKKAWELSVSQGKRYARAQRTMGMDHFQAQRMEECIECLALSLSISPMYPKAWLWLGCAHMKGDSLDKAAQAFLRVVQQVPDDGETWNNLGAVYLRLEKKEEAFKAFEQAIKHLQEKPKIWQNLLYCCLETQRWQQAMFTMLRLVKLSWENLDYDALEFLCNKAIHERENRGKLQRAMVQLVEVIAASPLSSDASIWRIFADFSAGIGDPVNELEYRQKQIRQLLSGAEEWKVDVAKFEILAEASMLLVECLVGEGSTKSVFHAKTHLSSLVKQATELYPESEGLAKMAAKQAELA